MTKPPISAQPDIMTGIFGLHTGIRAPDAGNSQTATVIRASDAAPEQSLVNHTGSEQ